MLVHSPSISSYHPTIDHYEQQIRFNGVRTIVWSSANKLIRGATDKSVTTLSIIL